MRSIVVGVALSVGLAGAAAGDTMPEPRPVDPDCGDLNWIIRPDWMKASLTIGEYTAYKPGRAVVECTLRNGRPKQCRVIEEDPVGRNYGRLAIALAGMFKAASKDSKGQPVEGRVVRIPVVVKIKR